MRRITILVAALAGFAGLAGAQGNPPTYGLEVRAFAGAYVPTGAMRSDFKASSLLGAQVAHEYSENLHFVGSLGWADGRNHFSTLSSRSTAIWQYDAGFEVNLVEVLNQEWLFRPLIGFGAGGRTYDYRAAGVSNSTCAVGYGNVGAEFQRQIVAIRLEARDNVSCFKSPITSGTSTRNDLGLTVGLVYHVR